MPSPSENQSNNPSEFLPSNDRAISKPITNNISGVLYGLENSYIFQDPKQSSLSPNNLIFATTGISNGYSTIVSGITNFTAYNDYIHYSTMGSNSVRLNIYGNLVRATNAFRFEIYNRQYR